MTSPTSPRVTQLDVPVCTLGEAPLWSDRDGCLYYVDIVEQRVHAYTPTTNRHQSWAFDAPVGSLAECKSGGLLVAVGGRLVRLDPSRAEHNVEPFLLLEGDRPENRLNDGKADPWGRFWVGSMRMTDGPAAGRLWCVNADGKAEAVRDGIGISNGAAFDRARGYMYFSDSTSDLIERAELDDARRLGPFQPFVRAGKGAPDGSTVDASGRLWNAEWGGYRICCYTPEGTLERVLPLPTSRPSCCSFGGEHYRGLFVTTARAGMNDEELARDPQAGGLFYVELDDVEGLPADQFAL